MPCHLFDPCLVMTFTRAAPLRPNSAEKLLAATRTSCTSSALGLMLVTPLRWLESMEAESMRKLLDSAREPLAFRLMPIFRIEDVAGGLSVSLSAAAGEAAHTRGEHHQGRRNFGRKVEDRGLPSPKPGLTRAPQRFRPAGASSVTVTVESVPPTTMRMLTVLVSAT